MVAGPSSILSEFLVLTFAFTNLLNFFEFLRLNVAFSIPFREVIIEDSLGICDELDRRMQHLVDTYHDEWAEVVKDPKRRAKFKQFVNTDEVQTREEMIEFIDQRGQVRPTNWQPDGQVYTNWRPEETDIFARSEKSWVNVGKTFDFAPNVGSAILYGESQLAVFNNAKKGEWYVTQNMCPHKQAFVLSQGIIGGADGISKVACPLHKKQFGLADGQQLDGDLSIITFPVKVVGDDVMVELPSEAEVNAILGTSGLRVQSSCMEISGTPLEQEILNGVKNSTAALALS
jgi:nitrite reductase (NADH) large subunit